MIYLILLIVLNSCNKNQLLEVNKEKILIPYQVNDNSDKTFTSVLIKERIYPFLKESEKKDIINSMKEESLENKYSKDFPVHLYIYRESKIEDFIELVNYLKILRSQIDNYSFNNYVNGFDERGYSPIHLAILFKRCDILKCLLDNKDDLNLEINKITLHEYLSPLSLAINLKIFYESDKKDNIIKLLLESKEIDINFLDIEKISPCGYAALNGDEKLLKFLINNKDYKFQDKEVNPLSLAALNNNNEVFKFLVEKKLSQSLKDDYKKIELVNYLFTNSKIKELLRDIPHDSKEIIKDYINKFKEKEYEMGITPILSAFDYENGNNISKTFSNELENHLKREEVIFNLCKNDENIKLLEKIEHEITSKKIFEKDKLIRLKMKLLNLSLKNGSNKIINFVLKDLNDLYYHDENGLYYPHMLVKENKVDLLEKILQKAKEIYGDLEKYINLKDKKKGNTSLHIASKKGYINLVKLLLDEGASLEEVNNKGKTSLHLAVEKNSLTLVKELLKRGAGANKKDNEGNTPLDYARLKGEVDIINLLLENESELDLKDKKNPPFKDPNNEKFIGKKFEVIEKVSIPYAYSSKGSMNNILISAIRKAEDEQIDYIMENIEKDEGIKRTDLRYENKNFLMLLLEQYGINYETTEWQKAKNLVKSKIEIFKKHIPYFISIINDSDSSSKTLIFYAIDTGIGEIVTTLIDTKEIDLEHLNKDGLTPLNYCILNETSIFNYLYEKRINSSNFNYLSKFRMSKSKEVKGIPPLLFASIANKPDILKKLLRQGAGFDLKNDYDIRAMALVALKGHEEIVEELLFAAANYLVRKGIIQDNSQTTIGLVIKAFLEKLIDVGIKNNVVVATNIPFGIDLKAFDVFNSEIEKGEAYKEVRRIYKKGKWVTYSDHMDIHIAIEYGKLLADILDSINKSYTELMKLRKIVFKQGDNEALKKILAIEKFDYDEIKDYKGGEQTLTNINKLIDHLFKKNNGDKNVLLEKTLRDFKDKVDDQIEENKRNLDLDIEEENYPIFNNLRDSFTPYLDSQGGVPTFYKLENVFNETLDAFKELVSGKGKEEGYENLMNYLYEIMQKRDKAKGFFDTLPKKFNENFKKLFGKSDEKSKDATKANSVLKINALFADNSKKKIKQKESLEKIYIIVKNDKDKIDKDIDKVEEKGLDLPSISFGDDGIDNIERFRNFVTLYKNLLNEREKLFGFIKRNFN